MYAEQLLPHDVVAEEAVLGSILIDSDAFLKVSSRITPDDFYREKTDSASQPAPSLLNVAKL